MRLPAEQALQYSDLNRNIRHLFQVLAIVALGTGLNLYWFGFNLAFVVICILMLGACGYGIEYCWRERSQFEIDHALFADRRYYRHHHRVLETLHSVESLKVWRQPE